MFWASQTKQENDGWEIRWLKTATPGYSDKMVFQEISKIFKSGKGIQISKFMTLPLSWILLRYANPGQKQVGYFSLFLGVSYNIISL